MSDAPANTPRNRGRIFIACKWGMIQGPNSVREKFQLCKECGYDGMELTNPFDAPLAEVRAASRETGMPVHGLVNIQGNRKAHLASPDPSVREQSVALLTQSIRNSHDYGGSSVLLVPGRVGPGTTHDELWQRSVPLIRQVLPLASRLGVRILIETVWNGFCETPEQLRDFVDEINSPWFGVYLDLGNVQKFAPTEQWVRKLGTRVVKVDVKGYTKEQGLRAKIGDDEVNWPAVCDALAEFNYNGWATAEVQGGKRAWLTEVAERTKRVMEC
jgi:hexulose-6-phosphate isomerase